jgi:RecA/RadA recombinase
MHAPDEIVKKPTAYNSGRNSQMAGSPVKIQEVKKMAERAGNIEWIDIGVDGLAEFVPGLPKGDAILVRGEPGTGKTILCLQFLHKGAELGEKCIYVTTEETPETILRTGTELWSDFPTLVENGTIKIINLSITATYASEYSLVNKAEVMAIVMGGLKAQPGATRIVIDSLSSLGWRLSDETEFREVFMRLLLETKKMGGHNAALRRGHPNVPGYHRVPGRPPDLPRLSQARRDLDAHFHPAQVPQCAAQAADPQAEH